MKLAIIMDRYDSPYAGTESQVLKLVEGLTARGWSIRFAVFRSTDFTLSDQFSVPVEHLGVQSMSSPKSWWKVYQYARSIRRQGYTLVHVFFNDASVICPPMMGLAGIKTVISRRDMGFWYTPKYLRALRLTGRWVSAAVCNSRAVAEITLRQEQLETDRVHVIYNGYPDASTLADSPLNNSEVPGCPVIIGIVANLRPIKRIFDLIEAVARLVSGGFPVELHIVGGGDQKPYMSKIQELGIEASVSLIGSQPDAERYIQTFDIAVLCSETEGFSNAIIEYMRCAKPVVCTQTGGNPEIVEDGVTGYLVPVGDVDTLTERLRHLIEMPDLRVSMGKAGQERIHSRYSLADMLNRHIDVYDRIAPEVMNS
ncbi:glycosyltransferase [Marinobacter similis]|uniref:Glycosyl transferase family 1 n=1 Tax=Marinobacter similis TaxID=1420916 RepID=W5YEY9_9GAMM|nr:glycosyltransferase [Marinobacter similis]AHI27767.1 glycosyl transferase family 1 [Marinobacter similis]